MRLQPLVTPVVGAACAEVLLGLAEAASVRCVVLPRFLSMGSTAVCAVVAFTFALLAFSDVYFEIGIVELRIVAHEPPAYATGIAFHRGFPLNNHSSSRAACKTGCQDHVRLAA